MARCEQMESGNHVSITHILTLFDFVGIVQYMVVNGLHAVLQIYWIQVSKTNSKTKSYFFTSIEPGSTSL